MRRLDLVKQKYSRLEVISFTEVRKGESFWLCRCDCGNELEVKGARLKGGLVRSCGCLALDILRERNKLPKPLRVPQGQSGFVALYSHYKRGAKTRGLDFTLTKQEFKDLTSVNCTYCGIRPSSIFYAPNATSPQAIWNSKYFYNGIDRINNKIGYIFSNCAGCCKHCNYAKKEMSVEDFHSWLKRAYNHSIQKIKD